MNGVRWLDDREARMWRAYLTMQRDLERVIERQLSADAGLSSADYALLVPLSEAPGRRLRVRDLGQNTGWDRSRLSHHIGRMEKRGLVKRTNCPTDGRGTFVQLTDEGVCAMTRAAPGHVDTVRRSLVDILTPAEIEALRVIAERVSARIAADGDQACSGEDPCEESA